MIAVLGLVAPAPPNAAAQAEPAPFCRPGQTPELQLGLADLHARLGPTMGEPLECEHQDAGSGDTVQRTTAGLAFYRVRTNTPTFTSGSETWALSPRGRGLLLWTGGSIDPPEPTAEEHDYFRRWLPILDREIAIYDRLGPFDLELDRGNFEAVDAEAVQTGLVDLRTVEADFAALGPPPRLAPFHGHWRDRLTFFGDYLQFAVRALASNDSAERTELLQQADARFLRSRQATRDANTAFESVLPRELDQPGGIGAPDR